MYIGINIYTYYTYVAMYNNVPILYKYTDIPTFNFVILTAYYCV